jgi:hypothetical protein
LLLKPDMNISLERLAIFAGPSRSDQLDPGGARIFPPARSGDVRNAAENGFTHIVLADTLFLDAPPNHGEIMEVMSLGASMFGCGSAGALRAIELRNSGMIGCGIVHDLYRAGKLRDDSELACVIDDEYRAVTPTLIEIRYYLGHALALGAPAQSIAHAFEELHSIYYMRRDYDTVRRVLAQQVGVGGQRGWGSIEDAAFRVKSIDLENCLADIAVSMRVPAIPFRCADINAGWLERGLLLGL